MTNGISEWPEISTLEDDDEVLARRPGDVRPEKRVPLAAFDARYVRAPEDIPGNILFGVNIAGAPVAVEAEADSGIAIADGQISATGRDHLGFALMSVMDFNAEIIVNSGAQPRRLPMFNLLGIAASDPPYIDAFGAPSGSDWTLPLRTAMGAGVPFRLRPQTYLAAGDLNTGSATRLDMRGTPGLSIIRRPAPNAGSGIYFSSTAATVWIDGVALDFGGNGSTGWGAYFNSPTTLRIARSAFLNAGTGGFGTGALIAAATAEPDVISAFLDDVEFSGNVGKGLWIEHAANVDLARLRIHGNGTGFQAQRYDTRVGEPIKRLVLRDSWFWGNTGAGALIGQYNQAGGSGQVLGPDQPDVSEALIEGCYAWGNGGYGFALQAERLRLAGCQTDANGSLGEATINARFVDVDECTFANSQLFGLDTGGSKRVRVRNTRIVGAAHYGFNPGGCLDVETDGLLIEGCAGAISLYANEASGAGQFFPYLANAARFRNTRIDISACTLPPIIIRDRPFDVVFDGLDVASSSSAQNPTPLTLAQLMDVRADQVAMRNLRFNGRRRATLTAAATLVIPDAATEAVVTGSTPITAIRTASMHAAVAEVSYLEFTSGGAGLTSCAATISGDGTGAAFTIALWNGAAVGSRRTAGGTGYTAATVGLVCNGGATPPVFTPRVGLPPPLEWSVDLYIADGCTVLGTGIPAGSWITIFELAGAVRLRAALGPPGSLPTSKVGLPVGQAYWLNGTLVAVA